MTARLPVIPPLRRALADDLRAVLGPAGPTVHAQKPATVDPPCWVLGWPTEVRYNETIAGGCSLTWPLLYVVTMGDVEAGQDEMDVARDPANPILAHLQRPRPEHGAWRSLAINYSSEPFPYTQGDTTASYLACEFVAEITAAGQPAT